MPELLITNAALLDVAAGTLHDGSSLRITGDRISEVAPGRRLDPREGDDVLNAAGNTLMPGLIDAHVHAAITTLDLAAMARRPATRVGIETKTVLEGMLQRGFTTVRDAGGLDRGSKKPSTRG
jgi:imidazolonepropionase-like amidohydrolase